MNEKDVNGSIIPHRVKLSDYYFENESNRNTIKALLERIPKGPIKDMKFSVSVDVGTGKDTIAEHYIHIDHDKQIHCYDIGHMREDVIKAAQLIRYEHLICPLDLYAAMHKSMVWYHCEISDEEREFLEMLMSEEYER